MINPILHNTTVSNPTLIKDIRRSSRRLNQSIHTSSTPDHVGIRPDSRYDLATNGKYDEDELTRGRSSRLRQDKRPTDDG